MIDWRAGLALALMACVPVLAAGAAADAAPSVFIDELTSPELKARIVGGVTTVLLPIGATEQSGPHMVLGKHNVRAQVLAQRIAQQLGNAVVAPVLAYVPEGAINPPTQHMKYTGTVSIPEPVFEATLEAAARSFRQHGFRDVVLLGDHGGYRTSLERVAAKLNREFDGGRSAQPGCRVHALGEYYRAAASDFPAALKAQGFSAEEIGSHAGLADTALAMAVDPALVRKGAAAARPKGAVGDGVVGDPRRATAELGQPGIDRIVEVSVAAIRERTRR